MLSSREVNQTYFLRGEELWPTKRLVRIQRVRVRRNRMANTAAHRAKAQARQSKSIATAGIPTVREISDRRPITATKRHRKHKAETKEYSVSVLSLLCLFV